MEHSVNVSVERDIVYKTYGYRKLHLDLFQVLIENDALSPAVIIVHGGGWNSGDKSMMDPIASKFAANGYVAVNVEYRLSLEAKFPAAIFDIKSAVIWLKTNFKNFYVYNYDKILN